MSDIPRRGQIEDVLNRVTEVAPDRPDDPASIESSLLGFSFRLWLFRREDDRLVFLSNEGGGFLYADFPNFYLPDIIRCAPGKHHFGALDT